MGATPLGLLLSLIGLVLDKEKRPALWGLLIGGALFALFLVVQLC